MSIFGDENKYLRKSPVSDDMIYVPAPLIYQASRILAYVGSYNDIQRVPANRKDMVRYFIQNEFGDMRERLCFGNVVRFTIQPKTVDQIMDQLNGEYKGFIPYNKYGYKHGSVDCVEWDLKTKKCYLIKQEIYNHGHLQKEIYYDKNGEKTKKIRYYSFVKT